MRKVIRIIKRYDGNMLEITTGPEGIAAGNIWGVRKPKNKEIQDGQPAKEDTINTGNEKELD